QMSFNFNLVLHFREVLIMPVIGWLLGATIQPLVRSYTDWIAFVLLVSVGAHMIYTSMRGTTNRSTDPSRGWTMILLSIAVSVDALVVGVSLGVLGIFVWYPAILIGVVTGVLSLIGLRVGRIVGKKFGKPVEIIGGLVLIGIGVRILLIHFFG
ncbi:MAG TPA: manganese efflux pump MntP family protein, partial [Anaerolineales bacterium]